MNEINLEVNSDIIEQAINQVMYSITANVSDKSHLNTAEFNWRDGSTRMRTVLRFAGAQKTVDGWELQFVWETSVAPRQ